MTLEITYNLNEINEVARRLLDAVDNNKIIAFYGEMGVGKTTLINAIARQLGVTDDTTNSPSFSIVNEYLADDGSTIYHFDLYRFLRPEEALDIGIEDYFDSGSLCLIEWPDRIEPFLPDDTVTVGIRLNPDDSRTLVIP